ncbi:MAG: aldehyde dehydrogenase family protein, partial [Actinobacteria bacterium]|nr:aldehyde dehydrogenase family protein [Actinomycetota bacterium]
MSPTYDVINPATEKIVTTIEHFDLEATDAAIAKAAKAFETWRSVTPADRGAMLRRFAAVVASHKEELAALEIANSGHTRGNALWEVDNVVNVLTY